MTSRLGEGGGAGLLALQLTLLLLQELELTNLTMRQPRLCQQEEDLRKTTILFINHQPTIIISNLIIIILSAKFIISKFNI